MRINSARKFHCKPDWTWDTRKHAWRDFDLWAVFQGQGRLETPQRVFDLGPGDCFLLRAGEHYRGSLNPRNPLVVIAAHFDFLDSKARLVRPLPQVLPPLQRRMNHLPFFQDILERVVEEHGRGSTSARLWLQCALAEMERVDRLPKQAGPALDQTQKIEALCRQILQDPARTWSVPAMARTMHCTRHHFARMFRKHRNVSPSEFVIRARIDAAKGLLRNSSHPITRIAELLGYRDVYFFAKQFKLKAGVTPARYRKQP